MEKSPSGAPIHRYQESNRKFEFAVGDSENIELMSRHIETHVGPVKTVYHELISDLVHIDVHIVAPRPERDCFTLVTSGMSDRAMNTPEGAEEWKYSELLICLPPYWPMGDDNFKREENYWPIRLLKFLARFPHEYNTWFWNMHTMPNGDPAEPWHESTAMTGLILLPSNTLPGEFGELVVDETKTIHFHAVVPLHTDEMDLKLNKGAEALLELFDQNEVSELLDPRRPSVIPRRKTFYDIFRRR